MRKRLTALRDAAEKTSFTPEMREKLARYLDYATLSVERWQLETVEFDTVADGLTVTYRRARQLLPDDWPGVDAEHLHDLRRRVVEHRHQMDLIEPLWPRLGALWAQEAQRLRNQLGACQDLAVLAQFHRAASAAGALALAAGAADRRPPRGASEERGAAGRTPVRREAEGVPPPHRRAVEREAGA